MTSQFYDTPVLSPKFLQHVVTCANLHPRLHAHTPSQCMPTRLHHRPAQHMWTPMHLHTPAHSRTDTLLPMCMHMWAVSFLFFFLICYSDVYSALLIKKVFLSY